ncbi:hypothetical protein MKK63_11290 [Methylobacterium sp. J-088]|uniref:hypothetical protein n=1 Tax=Methylobacterium sp. J-088 TaxID=2836664 RepID=UPI001FBB6C7D|nr:hypothetical protein [Methylobacterium sp. J-088]MCJ2063293.1 hypothetical protein [Methylobacterium sp. J-088]
MNRLGSVLAYTAEMHETHPGQRIDRMLALFTPLVTIAAGGLIVSVIGGDPERRPARAVRTGTGRTRLHCPVGALRRTLFAVTPPA